MRNTLLTCAACLLLLALLWCRPGRPAQRALQPAPVTRSGAPPGWSPEASVGADSAAPVALNATQLTARALHTFERDPRAALADIAQADQLDGPHDEVRRGLEIKALVQLGQVGHARALTEAFYRAFPGSPRCAELERLTGSHPRP